MEIFRTIKHKLPFVDDHRSEEIYIHGKKKLYEIRSRFSKFKMVRYERPVLENVHNNCIYKYAAHDERTDVIRPKV